jgi:hypothetical protein
VKSLLSIIWATSLVEQDAKRVSAMNINFIHHKYNLFFACSISIFFILYVPSPYTLSMFKSNCVIALLILQLVYSVGCYDKDFVTIKADDTYFDDGRKGFGLDQLYHLNSNTIKNHLGIIQRITIPESFKQKKLCWGSIYFTGIKNMEWKKSVPFIVADYDKEQPLFIVDHNSNFDFSDDSIIQVLPKNPFFVDLKNVNYPKAIFRVQLNFFNDNTQVFFDVTDSSDRYRKPLPLNFLMQENRFNYRKVFLPDSNVITLHDSNCNGLYNDEEGWFESNSPDKIMAGDIIMEIVKKSRPTFSI